MFSKVTCLVCCINVFALSFVSQLDQSNGCQELKGIGDTEYDYYTVSDLVDVPFTGHYVTFAPAIIPTFRASETPMQGRLPVFTQGGVFGTLSSYEEKALEFFGRIDKSQARRRCETTDPDGNNSELFKIHRNVALWYIFHFGIRYHYPASATAQFTASIEGFGLDPEICDGDKYYTSHCYDTSTPWGLSYAVATEYYEFGLNDGWNVDGSYSRKVNKIPYQDFRDESRRYIPKNSPWKLELLNNWQPLVESDELGFVYYQEHVTPHIGYTAKSIIYTNDEICERSELFKKEIAQADNYDYNYEIEVLLERMSGLTDLSKMEIEFFDAKSNLATFLRQYEGTLIPGINPTMFEFWVYEMAYLLNTYETVIPAWKEKVDFDRVRPPSIISELLGEQEITTYGGVTPQGETLGTTSFPANNFEAYIRTMPHAEYPSGSGCICKSWASAMIELFDTDDVTSLLPDGFQLSFGAFSSSKEPLSTPSSDISVSYNSFSEIAQRCGETRLEGGMHFTASVPDSFELCKDIGTRIGTNMRLLANGIRPDYIVDIEDFSLNNRECYPDDSESSSSSSRSRSSSSSRSKSSSKSNSKSSSSSSSY